jgi:hypothetical protein
VWFFLPVICRGKRCFKSELETNFPRFKAWRNENEAEHIIPITFVSAANNDNYDFEAGINAAEHKEQIQSCRNTTNVSEFSFNKIKKTEGRVIANEAAFSFHAVNII